MSDIAPIAYHFLNSPDGYKLLFADGFFCEFAVFEPQELQHIPFSHQWLLRLVQERAISVPDAFMACTSRHDFELAMQQAGMALPA